MAKPARRESDGFLVVLARGGTEHVASLLMIAHRGKPPDEFRGLAMPEIQKKFTDTDHGVERRLARQGIAKGFKTGVLNRLERDLITCLANLWFHHRGENGEGNIRPGKKLLANRAKCSERTVARLLKRLREAQILIPISYLKGGRRATRYKLDMRKLMDWCGVYIPKETNGALKLLARPLQFLGVTVQSWVAGRNRAIPSYGYSNRWGFKILARHNQVDPPIIIAPGEHF